MAASWHNPPHIFSCPVDFENSFEYFSGKVPDLCSKAAYLSTNNEAILGMGLVLLYSISDDSQMSFECIHTKPELI